MQLARSGDHSRAMPLKHGGQCVRSWRCHQGSSGVRRIQICYFLWLLVYHKYILKPDLQMDNRRAVCVNLLADHSKQ